MAAPLLAQIHSQIRGRARELEPAVREAEQLTAALAVLDGLGAGAPTKAQPAAETTSRRSRRTAPNPRGSRSKRAQRGANRAAVPRCARRATGRERERALGRGRRRQA